MLFRFKSFLITRQSPTDVPQTFRLDNGARTQLTKNVDTAADLTASVKQRFYVTRADGFKFKVTVTLPSVPAGAVAENAVENARRGNLAAQAALEDAKARLANAQRNLDNTTLKAPYDGIVSERQVNAGDIVAPGSPMFTIVDPSTMRLEGSVPADQLGAVHLGASVKFGVTGYPGTSFVGTISNIYPSADPQTKQVRL